MHFSMMCITVVASTRYTEGGFICTGVSVHGVFFG